MPHPFLLGELDFWELVKTSEPLPLAVLAFLAAASVFSWTIIFAKLTGFRKARSANQSFLKMFRKTPQMQSVATAARQFKDAPLAGVFAFGFSEVSRQVAARQTITNQPALERTLQLGISEELTRLERHMNWLATTASVAPFVGLFGTVLGIIEAFQALSLNASASMRAVGPGIAHALFATAVGLFAAIPAAIFYNYFGHVIKELGARMDDFSLEFLNLAERNLES